MNIFKRSLDKRERDAGLSDEKVERPNKVPKTKASEDKDAPKPKKSMSQADFSGYKKGGEVKKKPKMGDKAPPFDMTKDDMGKGKRGWGKARCK